MRRMHVMIATDGTEEAEDAAHAAVDVFGTDPERIDYSLVSVGVPMPVEAITPLGIQPSLLMVTKAGEDPVVDVTEAPERHLEEAAEALGLVGVETIVAIGAPGPTICALAAERHVDVIVVGAHDRGWLSRLVEPSVTHHVVDNAPCHVMVVRRGVEEIEADKDRDTVAAGSGVRS